MWLPKFLPLRQAAGLSVDAAFLPPEHKQLLKNAQLELKKSKRKDYYKILGVDKNASEDEIKKAYRKRALMHHPGERWRRCSRAHSADAVGTQEIALQWEGGGAGLPVLQAVGGATFQTWTIIDFVFLCPWFH